MAPDPLDDYENEGFSVRRHMDKEFMRGIERMSELEKEMAKVQHALFGVSGDNGLYGMARSQRDELRKMRAEHEVEMTDLKESLGGKFDRLIAAVLGGTLAIIVSLVTALVTAG